MTESAEDPLVAQAFDPKSHDNLARAIEKLKPDEAAYFLHKLEHAVKKRKLQLTGYLAAMGAWLVGMVGALFVFGTYGYYWIFAVPFGVVGAILYFVGRHADRVGATPGPPPPPGMLAKASASADRTET